MSWRSSSSPPQCCVRPSSEARGAKCLVLLGKLFELAYRRPRDAYRAAYFLRVARVSSQALTCDELSLRNPASARNFSTAALQRAPSFDIWRSRRRLLGGDHLNEVAWPCARN